MSTVSPIFEHLESEVRGYCRSFPTTFTHATGARMKDADGVEYIDFFAGAGALNYGHNRPELKKALLEYLAEDRVIHTLDMHTEAKAAFLETFEEVVLKPRGMDMKAMFPGPTGTNAVEAALKLARKVTGRRTVVAYTSGFHGMTLGSLAVTGNASKRAGAGIPLSHATALPFDGYEGSVDSLDLFEAMLDDGSSGLDKPAAVILETVQAEGGVNVASVEWLKRLRAITEKHGVLLIADDIQVGCGRTGAFFSFERAGIQPDIITLSKSLSGFGLPFALTIFRRDLDVWSPGEHNGTFRGFNLAMVTARAALEHFWRDDSFAKETREKAELAAERIATIANRHERFVHETRGLGLIQGLACTSGDFADLVTEQAFQRGLIIETAGADGDVVKLLPPLAIPREDLEKGLDILEAAFDAAARKMRADDEDEASTSGSGMDPVVHAGADRGDKMEL